MITDIKVAVVIPSYKVIPHILGLIDRIGPEVNRIYVIDDCCPNQSGLHVKTHCKDSRVFVIKHPQNLGVGGAVKTGYLAALHDEMEIIVKLDGDGQMDPNIIWDFVAPIIRGEADYTKGNRFYDIEKVRSMPKVRLLGNAALSFMNKISSGYWNLFDPTNGYTAIHRDVVKHLPLEKISNRYFFESDLLFRLNTLRAVVIDIPMEARYQDEVSNLKIHKILGEFLYKHFRNFYKRIFYNYYLRDMSIASFELPLAVALLTFGICFGSYKWFLSLSLDQPAASGVVMLAALPIIVGLQLFLSFLSQDIGSVPHRIIHRIKLDH
jgi:glycosyltransferase involved in cell wall biosynthesis